MPENVKFNNDKYAAKLGRPLITKTPPLDPTTRQIGNLSTGRFRAATLATEIAWEENNVVPAKERGGRARLELTEP